MRFAHIQPNKIRLRNRSIKFRRILLNGEEEKRNGTSNACVSVWSAFACVVWAVKWPNGAQMLQFNCTAYSQINNKTLLMILPRLCCGRSPFSTNQNACTRHIIHCYVGNYIVIAVPKQQPHWQHMPTSYNWTHRAANETHYSLRRWFFLAANSMVYARMVQSSNSFFFRRRIFLGSHAIRIVLINGWKKIASHVWRCVIFITYRESVV